MRCAQGMLCDEAITLPYPPLNKGRAGGGVGDCFADRFAEFILSAASVLAGTPPDKHGCCN